MIFYSAVEPTRQYISSITFKEDRALFSNFVNDARDANKAIDHTMTIVLRSKKDPSLNTPEKRLQLSSIKFNPFQKKYKTL